MAWTAAQWQSMDDLWCLALTAPLTSLAASDHLLNLQIEPQPPRVPDQALHPNHSWATYVGHRETAGLDCLWQKSPAVPEGHAIHELQFIVDRVTGLECRRTLWPCEVGAS